MGLTTRFAALIVAFWPVWRWWGDRLASDTDAVGALVALIPAAFLLWSDWDSSRDQRRPSIRTLALLGVYILLFTSLPPLARALLASTILAVECRPFFRHRSTFAATWALLLFSLPSLATTQFFLGYPLRIFVGAASAWILRLYGYAVARDGVLLRWGSVTFAVDAPCSGVRMLWATAVMVLFLAGYWRFSWKRVLIFSSGAGLAVVGANVVRTVIFFLAAQAHVSLEGWRHDAAGGFVFALTVVLIAVVGSRLRPLVRCEA